MELPVVKNRKQTKSVLDKSTRDELSSRIQTLNERRTARRGKMNVYQMLRHCMLCEELYLGKTKHKRALTGLIFGKIGVRNILDESRAIPKSAPTADAFKVKEATGGVEVEKEKWIALLDEYKAYPNEYVHWFFGKMSGNKLAGLCTDTTIITSGSLVHECFNVVESLLNTDK